MDILLYNGTCECAIWCNSATSQPEPASIACLRDPVDRAVVRQSLVKLTTEVLASRMTCCERPLGPEMPCSVSSLTWQLLMRQVLHAELEQDQVIHADGFSPSWLHIPRTTAAEFCKVRVGCAYPSIAAGVAS